MNKSQVLYSRQQFLTPVLLKEGEIEALVEKLLSEDFIFFDLKDEELQSGFYGGVEISHLSLETYFMSNIESILFPKSVDAREHIRRFSKTLGKEYRFIAKHLNVKFIIDSIDIFICPYHIGLINLRVRLPGELSNDEVLTFSEMFRYLVPTNDYNKDITIDCGDRTHNEMKDFLFHNLLEPFRNFMEEHIPNDPSYYGSLPFYKDERMYVISYFNIVKKHELFKMDLYRIAELNGFDEEGGVYVGATNPKYIENYYEHHLYDRWAPNTYYAVSESHFACITKEEGKTADRLLKGMYGEFFYALLLLLYYKLVLLKLSHEHSQIEIEKDHPKVDLLTIMINDFSAKYYLPELSSNASGKEMSTIIHNVFQIEKLYNDVNHTLSRLFQKQEKHEGKQINAILQILTIYTVISGIYGMNLVIDDLSGNINWSNFVEFSLFEWIVVFVTATGIILSFSMGFFFLKRWFQEKRSKKRKMY